MTEQAEKAADQPEAAPTNWVIEEALEKGDIGWEMLLGIAAFEEETPAENVPLKRMAGQYRFRATEMFKSEHDGAKVLLVPPIGGVYLLGDGAFQWTFNSAEIHFDWSEAWPLVFRIEALAEEAREWWRPRKRDPGEGWFTKFRRVLSLEFGADRSAVVRQPHSVRAFGLATWLMGAIQQENARHPLGASENPPKPTDTFKANLANYRAELAGAQKRLREAAQRTAQSRYWHGTLIGVCLLTVICAVIGGIFWSEGASAAYAIAIPAGGLGAIVSLLQRMSSGKLVLDIDASRDLLEVFGAVRPFIGAVFGIAITALFAGGLLPAIDVPSGQELGFYAGVGFLAGFNERWAQDMLKSSADQFQTPAQEPAGGGAPALGGSGAPASTQIPLPLPGSPDVAADLTGGVDKDQ